MKKDDKEFDLSQVIGGALNILGLKIDLGKLLSSPEDVRDRLQELREKLKQAGGEEVLKGEEWQRGGVSISGRVSTRGILGEREYHIGTGARPRRQPQAPKAPKRAEVAEPAVDVFDEPQEIMVVVEVPGVGLNDLELKIEERIFSLHTRPEARIAYRKEIKLAAEVDAGSLKATCRNGILEVRLRKKTGKSE